jgi:hypothetical protein
MLLCHLINVRRIAGLQRKRVVIATFELRAAGKCS